MGEIRFGKFIFLFVDKGCASGHSWKGPHSIYPIGRRGAMKGVGIIVEEKREQHLLQMWQFFCYNDT